MSTSDTMSKYREYLGDLGDTVADNAASVTPWSVKYSGQVLTITPPTYTSQAERVTALNESLRLALEDASILEHRALVSASDPDITAYQRSVSALDEMLQSWWDQHAMGVSAKRVQVHSRLAEFDSAMVDQFAKVKEYRRLPLDEIAQARARLRALHSARAAIRPPTDESIMLVSAEPVITLEKAATHAARMSGKRLQRKIAKKKKGV